MKNNSIILDKYTLSYNTIYSNIIKILIDSYPRNIGLVNKKGFYESKYQIPLSINMYTIPNSYDTVPVTTYNKHYNLIFYSNITEKFDNINIEYISGISFNYSI
jgi:hypothetical protein